MGAKGFTEMEIDAIGEIMNISLGASATALSTLLGAKVNITTPKVKVQTRQEVEFHDLEPAVGVAISYTQGLSGKNVMMFTRNDVRIIVGMMMGMEIPEEEFEMDEMNSSAIREVMNQMMGSSATALSEFLGTTVDISTPVCFEVSDAEKFKEEYFPGNDKQVVVRFVLEIENQLSSEFLNIMATPLVKKLLEPFKEQFGLEEEPETEEEAAPEPDNGGTMDQSMIDALLGGGSSPEPAPSGGGTLDQSAIDALLGGGSSPAPAPSGGGTLDQSAIDALLGGGSSPAPAASGGGTLDQSAIDALLGGGSSAAQPQMTPAPQPQMTPAPQPQMTAQPQMAPAPQPQMAAQPQMTPQPQMQVQPQVVYQQPAGPDPVTVQLLQQMQQSQNAMLQLMKQMAERPQEAPRPEKRDNMVIHPMNSRTFGNEDESNEEEPENREMLMKVPLEISVEIGRTRKLVKDILEFTQGSLVVLDKMAGEQADLFVNGECIARGDIVVVEDNFGIRITEILNKEINAETL